MSGGTWLSGGAAWALRACSSSMALKCGSRVKGRLRPAVPDIATPRGGGPPSPSREGRTPGSFRGLLRRVAEDGFDLEVLLEAEVAPLAPVAALLVPAEGRHRIAAGAVDRHLAGPEVVGHLA